MSKLALKLIAENKRTKNKSLDLGNCGLTELPKQLFECVWLEELILSNQWWDYSNNNWIDSKNKGKQNILSVIDAKIKTLKNLKTLKAGGDYHSKWKISDISPLQRLTVLSSLNLSDNQISDISPLQGLTGLSSLNLSSNKISDISPLQGLTCLSSVYLGDNKISDISPLQGLTCLSTVYLSFNQISDISPLQGLTGLSSLHLSGNQIFDISPLQGLTGLSSLYLFDTQISDISPLQGLTRLAHLHLNENKIKKLPQSFFQMNMETSFEEYNRSGLSLFGNPIESPPIEIIKQGKTSVLDWFAANKKKLNEIKIILIGEPDAGKTSLLRRLKDNTFNAGEVQTDGINIENIAFGSCKHFEKQIALHQLTGHFWDFGGQEILNSSHQFFLTKRSVYVLVLDARKDTQVAAQLTQWIERIKATGGNSSIIVVANQIDVNPGFGFQNEYELQKAFPQVKYFIKASCATGEQIDFLREKLEELIPQAEMFNTEVDERWLQIKETLQEETKTKHFLSEERFTAVCIENKLTEKNGRLNAINFLNDLGLLLHFENLNLAAYYVLDPYWITYGVYQILTSARAGKQKGVVSMNDLEYIVNEEEDKKERYTTENNRKIEYSTNERRFLVDILHEFKLSFFLPDRTTFIIPDLLDTSEPVKITKTVREATGSIYFMYRYEQLPQGVIPHIMVDTHQILIEKWRTGCLLAYNGCKALVSNYQYEITIIVTGEHKKKREFMAIVRQLIDAINLKLRFKPSMLIPLPDSDSFVDYEEILGKEKDGKRDHTVYKPVKKSYDISMLLEGVPTPDEVSEIKGKLDEILAKQDIANDGVEMILVNQKTIKDKLDEHHAYLIKISENNDSNTALLDSIKDISMEQSAAVSNEIINCLTGLFEAADITMDDKLKQIYIDLKKSDNVEMKLKLSVPLINLLGVDLETKFDIKGWAKSMYKKHELKIFKLLGY